MENKENSFLSLANAINWTFKILSAIFVEEKNLNFYKKI
jgi:hypothetical protein